MREPTSSESERDPLEDISRHEIKQLVRSRAWQAFAQDARDEFDVLVNEMLQTVDYGRLRELQGMANEVKNFAERPFRVLAERDLEKPTREEPRDE